MTKSTIDDGHFHEDGPMEARGDGAGRADRMRPTADDAMPRHDTGHGGDTDDVPPPPRKRVYVFVLIFLALLLGYGAFKHWQTSQAADETQTETANFVPEVQTITAKAEQAPYPLTLPGETQPFDTATIYPRATGYVAVRNVDIGSRVKKNDLLLRIASPDLDRQVDQAKAQLNQVKATQAQAQASLDQAKANLELANVTFKRTNALTQRGYETVQNNDNQKTQVDAQQAAVETAQAGIKVAAANVQAQQATVDRLATLAAFEEVRAPFDGIVTTRGVDVGDLVNADAKTGTALFTVAADKVLRTTVHVPQSNAPGIHDGLVADVVMPQLPSKVFTGRIARSSVALLNSARTLDTEVDIDNPKGELRPGAFVNVTFHIPRERPNVVLPAEALVFNKDGLQVATVQDDEIHMQKVAIYRDFGKTVELRDGLSGGEQVVINPPVDLGEHSKVKVKEKPPEEQAKK